MRPVSGGHAIGQDYRVHGAGRGTGQRFDLDPVVFQQTVEYAPGKGAMGAASLEAKIDPLAFGCMAIRLSGAIRLRWDFHVSAPGVGVE